MHISDLSEDMPPAASKHMQEMINHAEIIGLGEANHGAKEFVQARRYFIDALSPDAGSVLILLEMSTGEGEDLNAYVQGERDDVEALLKGMPLWMFQTAEFLEFLKWVRMQNELGGHQYILAGLEVQYVDRSLKHILKYLESVAPDQAINIQRAFGAERVASATISAAEFHYLWAPMPRNDMNDYVDLVLQLTGMLDTNKEKYISISGKQAFQRARRHVENIAQFASMMIQSSERAKHQMRDFYMFENATWIRNVHGNPLTFIWAHNAHITKTEANGGYDVLGHLLKREHGDNYLAIGSTYGTGSFNAIDSERFTHKFETPIENALFRNLTRNDAQNFLLCLKCVDSKILSETYFGKMTKIRIDTGAVLERGRQENIILTRSMNLSKNYDAILYIDEIKAATPLLH